MTSITLSESYYKSPSDTEPLETTFNRLLEESAQKYAEREAFVFCDEDVRISFKELKERADEMAAGLLALGMQPGDRLVIWAPCCLEWVITQYAAIRAGILFTGLNPAYEPDEAAEILEKLNPKCIVTGERLKSGDAYGVLCQICPAIATSESGQIKSDVFPELKHVIVSTMQDLSGVTKMTDVSSLGGEQEFNTIKELEKTTKPTDVFTVQLTSGTTACPKAVLMSHYQLVNSSYFTGRRTGFADSDKVQRLCMPGMLFRCGALMLSSLSAVTHGITVVVPSKMIDPEKTVKAIAKENYINSIQQIIRRNSEAQKWTEAHYTLRCTCIFGNPPMMAALLKCPEFNKYDMSSLTGAILGGSSCSLSLMRFVVDKFKLQNVSTGMPMTEVGGLAMASLQSDSLEIKCKTNGYALENLEVKVVDTDGRTISVNNTGELYVRGYATPIGYYGTTNTSGTDDDGWFHTGDMILMNENGYMSSMGRKKDMILRGSDAIYPNVIEECLSRYPNVAAIQVVGVPVNSEEQRVCACVIIKGEVDEDEMKKFCENEHVPVPDYVCFVDSFPMTHTKKVRKNILLNVITKKLGL